MKNDSVLKAATAILMNSLNENVNEIAEAVIGSSQGTLYKGDPEDVIFLDDFEPKSHIKKLRYDTVSKKMVYQTAHLAYSADMPNAKSAESTEWYVFDKPQKFTHPALVPIKA